MLKNCVFQTLSSLFRSCKDKNASLGSFRICYEVKFLQEIFILNHHGCYNCEFLVNSISKKFNGAL